jgi:hypothetical protein
MTMLPKNVVVVGMPDFIGLAEESGAVVASPYSDAVGAGDSVKVKFQLHNASGQTGKPGKVTWTLPPGWKSSPAAWEHGAVPLGSNLKQVVAVTPQEGTTKGTASIVYQDSRFSWKKDFTLTLYPKATTITDCDSTTAWTAEKGASLTMERDMVRITPQASRTRTDESGRAVANTGRVTYNMAEAGRPSLPSRYRKNCEARGPEYGDVTDHKEHSHAQNHGNPQAGSLPAGFDQGPASPEQDGSIRY